MEAGHEPTSDRNHQARRRKIRGALSGVRCASQGATVEEARDNLREALALFFETASLSEVEQRLSGEFYVIQVEVEVG